MAKFGQSTPTDMSKNVYVKFLRGNGCGGNSGSVIVDVVGTKNRRHQRKTPMPRKLYV
jgi:hypothetical protein